MAMISDLLSVLAAAMAAFFGHLAAHDFVELTPRISSSLVMRAASQFASASERERYCEQWLADLNDVSGVFAKFKYALGCLFSVPRMKAEARRLFEGSIVVRYEFPGVGQIEMNRPTHRYITKLFRVAVQKSESRILNSFGPVIAKWYLYFWVHVSRKRGVNIAIVRRFVDLVAASEDVGKARVWINGNRIP
jgi:hypothetical protein